MLVLFLVNSFNSGKRSLFSFVNVSSGKVSNLTCMHFSQEMSSKNYTCININDYIDAIEKEVTDGKPTFKAKLRYQNQKPVIRTLIDIQGKGEFERLLRYHRKKAEYDKMRHFCQNLLLPQIRSLPAERRSMVPNFDHELSIALSMPTDRGRQTFHRLASGKEYKGILLDLVTDLAPEQKQLCIEAMEPLTDGEALLCTIDSVAQNDKCFDRKYERIEAARKCVDLFKNCDLDDDSKTNLVSPKVSGAQCEKACMNFLQNKTGKEYRILANVMINNVATKSRQKYMNHNNRVARNIVWTQCARDRITSELDAIVLGPSRFSGEQEKLRYIDEVWEAKATISPSSINDVLTKKGYAVKALLNDEELSITYDGNNEQLGENERGVVLGLFGDEVLSPSNAFGQLKSTAVAQALSSDVDIALNAIKCGDVELGIEGVLHDLQQLRVKYDEICKDFDVSVRVAS